MHGQRRPCTRRRPNVLGHFLFFLTPHFFPHSEKLEPQTRQGATLARSPPRCSCIAGGRREEGKGSGQTIVRKGLLGRSEAKRLSLFLFSGQSPASTVSTPATVCVRFGPPLCTRHPGGACFRRVSTGSIAGARAGMAGMVWRAAEAWARPFFLVGRVVVCCCHPCRLSLSAATCPGWPAMRASALVAMPCRLLRGPMHRLLGGGLATNVLSSFSAETSALARVLRTPVSAFRGLWHACEISDPMCDPCSGLRLSGFPAHLPNCHLLCALQIVMLTQAEMESAASESKRLRDSPIKRDVTDDDGPSSPPGPPVPCNGKRKSRILCCIFLWLLYFFCLSAAWPL